MLIVQVDWEGLTKAIQELQQKHSAVTVLRKGDVPVAKRASEPLKAFSSNSFSDDSYYGDAKVGSSSPQTFTVKFDTGSTTFFVPGPDCPSNQCVGPTRYKQGGTDQHSSTYVQYGIGTRSGKNYLDTVSIAGITVSNSQVVSLNQRGGSTYKVPDSLMGLGLGKPRGRQNTFFEDAMDQGKVSTKEFSFYLGRTTDGTGGNSELTLGGRDSSKFTGDAYMLPVVGSNNWDVTLYGIAVNGDVIDGTGGTAIMDTGTSLIIGPSDVVSKVYAKIPNAQPAGGHYWSVPCDSNPKLALKFEGGRYEMKDVDLIYDKESDTCYGSLWPRAVYDGNMSFAVNRVQKFAPSPDLPQTATVYDFACLFTHDLKRKAKRWQDGKLKYHTFNKKVMVYDDRGHFVGDAHWDGDEDILEGDELELDRGGVMVQVADCKGNREQDLTEVLDKRAREVAKRREQAAAKAPRQSAAHTTQPVSAPRRPPPPHLPLSGLLQSPGPIGRAAIPDKSPFEARRQVLSHIGEPKETPQKEGAPSSSRKRKLSPSPPSKAGFAQSLFGTRLNLSATPSAELLAARARALRERTNLQQRRLEEDEEQELEPPQKRPAVKASVLKTLSDSTLKAIGAARPQSHAQVVSIDDDSDEAVPVHEEEDTSPYFEAEEAVPAAKTKASKQQRAKNDSHDESLFVQSPVRKPIAAVKSSVFSATKRSKTIQPSAFEREQHTPIDTSSPPHSPQPSSPIVQRSKKSTKHRSPSPIRQKHVKQGAEIEESDHEPVLKRKPKQKARDLETKKEKEKPRAEEQGKAAASKRNGQRTELRIRSRKRRGLLMMTEQLPPPRQESPELSHSLVKSRQVTPGPVCEPTPEPVQPVTIESSPPPEPPQVEVSSTPAEAATSIPQQKHVEARQSQDLDLDVAEMTVPSTAPEQEVEMKVTETIESSESEQPPDNERDAVVDDEPDEAQANKPAEQSPVTESPVVAIASQEAEPESPEDTSRRQRRNLRRKAVKKYTVESDANTSDGDEEQDDKVIQIQINDSAASNASTDTSQGPRLMKMARRSVKSREIFGFVPLFGTASVPMQFATATAQL
ncbi:hypothetical protein Golomagni_05587, partial [Golovinomyces magnicellulatus]